MRRHQPRHYTAMGVGGKSAGNQTGNEIIVWRERENEDSITWLSSRTSQSITKCTILTSEADFHHRPLPSAVNMYSSFFKIRLNWNWWESKEEPIGPSIKGSSGLWFIYLFFFGIGNWCKMRAVTSVIGYSLPLCLRWDSCGVYAVGALCRAQLTAFYVYNFGIFMYLKDLNNRKSCKLQIATNVVCRFTKSAFCLYVVWDAVWYLLLSANASFLRDRFSSALG